MAKNLQLATPLQPNRVEIINLLRIGLAISLTGLVLAFLASETTVVSIIATAIAIFSIQVAGSKNSKEFLLFFAFYQQFTILLFNSITLKFS